MESLLTLPLAGEARVRILQITDTHLFAEKHETLLGVNTWDSYQSVLDAIHAESPEYDLIVATGDLAQDQSAAAYQHFAGCVTFSTWSDGDSGLLASLNLRTPFESLLNLPLAGEAMELKSIPSFKSF